MQARIEVQTANNFTTLLQQQIDLHHIEIFDQQGRRIDRLHRIGGESTHLLTSGELSWILTSQLHTSFAPDEATEPDWATSIITLADTAQPHQPLLTLTRRETFPSSPDTAILKTDATSPLFSGFPTALAQSLLPSPPDTPHPTP